MKCDSSNCSFFGGVLAIQSSLRFCVNFKISFCISAETKQNCVIGIFIRIASNLQLSMSSFIILTLHPPAHYKDGLPPYASSQSPAQQHLVTFSSSIALLKLITEYFILFNAVVNWIILLFCFSEHLFCVLVSYPTIVLTVLNLSCLMTSCGILRASCI